MEASNHPPKVLVVDDEPFMLRALERSLSFHFEPITADDASRGLQLARDFGPFEVVISDMWMPNMDGIQFLSQMRVEHPDCVRILLTGRTDEEAASGAVNQGGVYKYLTKPCPPEALIEAVKEAVDHRKERCTERAFLSETLTGLVEVLANVVAVTSPTVFERTERLRSVVMEVVSNLGLEDPWKYEVASTLCYIGCVSLSEEVIRKALAGKELTDGEKRVAANHPEVAHRLLSPIPRMESIANMVRYQNRAAPEDVSGEARKGAQVIRMCAHFLRLQDARLSSDDIRERLLHVYPETLVLALGRLCPVREALWVRIEDLQVGMVLDQDITSSSGTRLVTKGETVTDALAERLHRFARSVGVTEPFRVKSVSALPTQA